MTASPDSRWKRVTRAGSWYTVAARSVTAVDGVLADLGVSSHQFDEGDRGFSTRFAGPLDMRMDRRQQVSAADIIRTYTEQRLHKLFEQYGEVSNAKTLARKKMERTGAAQSTQ